MTLVELSCLSHMSDICDTFHTYTHFTHVLYWITKQVERKKMAPHDKSVCFFMGIINDVLLGNLRMWLGGGY